MAINKNWTRYEVDIGWKEVPASEVFSKSIILKLLDETIYYNNGELTFNG